MYIKLTRLDNTPIWINAAFVVTVEPARNGGAVVVPIGDGLDYDVKESPEMVLGMLECAPEVKIVPVPVPESLTKMPEDVSPDPEPTQTQIHASAEPAPVEPEKKSIKAKPAKTPRKATGTRKARATKKVEPVLTDEQVDRIRRMAPGSIRKLQNTLATQFKVTEIDAAVKELETRGVMALDNDHVKWAQ